MLVQDNTPPVITATGTTLTLGCNPTAALINAALGTATATDNCSSVTPTPSDGSIAALTADKYLDELAESVPPEQAERDAEDPSSWRTSYVGTP